jgi:hypothetical protein
MEREMRAVDPRSSMGIVACVLMEGLLTGMARAGQDKEALSIISGALVWFDQPRFRRSALMQTGRDRLNRLANEVKLLANAGDEIVQ